MPEEKARQEIDKLLNLSGWTIQDYSDLNLGASFGVAIPEFPLKSDFPDYLLFVNRKPIGILEVKPQRTPMSGIAEQSQKYLASIPQSLPDVFFSPCFAYESTGAENYFRDLADPDFRSRRVSAFNQPKNINAGISKIPRALR